MGRPRSRTTSWGSCSLRQRQRERTSRWCSPSSSRASDWTSSTGQASRLSCKLHHVAGPLSRELTSLFPVDTSSILDSPSRALPSPTPSSCPSPRTSHTRS